MVYLLVRLLPKVWYHFCIAVDYITKSMTFVWNGELLHDDLIGIEDLRPPRQLLENERIDLFIGYTEGTPPLDFSNDFFHGHMTDINIWSKALPLDQLQRFTQNCHSGVTQPSPDLLNWRKDVGKLKLGSKVFKEKIELQTTCHGDQMGTKVQEHLFSSLCDKQHSFLFC